MRMPVLQKEKSVIREFFLSVPLAVKEFESPMAQQQLHVSEVCFALIVKIEQSYQSARSPPSE